MEQLFEDGGVWNTIFFILETDRQTNGVDYITSVVGGGNNPNLYITRAIYNAGRWLYNGVPLGLLVNIL